MTELTFGTPLLPQAGTISEDYHDTSFFRKATYRQLPSPQEVRAKHNGEPAGLVKFEDLGLCVKYGPSHYVSVEEAQAMRAVQRTFRNEEVPVPELFAWKVSEGANFLYMSLVPGETLGECWGSLVKAEKESICDELAGIISSLRKLGQHPTEMRIAKTAGDFVQIGREQKATASEYKDEFIGSVNRGLVQDIYFNGKRSSDKAGPFTSVKDFNDAIHCLALPNLPASEMHIVPHRAHLPDDAPIRFCHGDLHFENIIISGIEGSRSIAGIVDWAQAGWYPEYWEYCKLRLGVWDTETEDEWVEAGYLSSLKIDWESSWTGFVEYWMIRTP